MAWGTSESFPRAILHIDGDSFFASCEVAKNPSLRGKPVITGKERGIVSAATYEAKARGVTRGMRLSEVRTVCPDAVILPSDYETYSIFSYRMYEIVRRYTPAVEEYSIDECFADLGGMRRKNRMSYMEMAERIKYDLESELGITFSLGLSVTKVLAKIGSKWKKPSGLTVIPLSRADAFLQKTHISQIWGIGKQTAAYLEKLGVHTAADYSHKEAFWVQQHLIKPYQEIWKELRGELVYELDTEGRQGYQSISKTKTFTPPSDNAQYVFSQLSKNVENACIKARRWNVVANEVSFFLKTQDFKYRGYKIKLLHKTSIPQDILHFVSLYFQKIFKSGVQYRATGVTLSKLEDAGNAQLDLFGSVQKTAAIAQVFEHVDTMSAKFGKHTLFLGSSLIAMGSAAHRGERGDVPERSRQLFKGETTRRKLPLPMLGDIR